MKYLTAEYEQTLFELAERLVTPERYGAALLLEDTVEIPVENLQGLWD